MLDANTIALLNQLGISTEAIDAAMTGMAVLTVLAIVAAIPTAMLAKRKGRSVAWWTIFALTIPLLPLVVVWLLPRTSASRDADR
jgi:hypothetical protein